MTSGWLGWSGKFRGLAIEYREFQSQFALCGVERIFAGLDDAAGQLHSLSEQRRGDIAK
jgi:hypothetical protein